MLLWLDYVWVASEPYRVQYQKESFDDDSGSSLSSKSTISIDPSIALNPPNKMDEQTFNMDGWLLYLL